MDDEKLYALADAHGDEMQLFDVAYAWEAVARGHALAGNRDQAQQERPTGARGRYACRQPGGPQAVRGGPAGPRLAWYQLNGALLMPPKDEDVPLRLERVPDGHLPGLVTSRVSPTTTRQRR